MASRDEVMEAAARGEPEVMTFLSNNDRLMGGARGDTRKFTEMFFNEDDDMRPSYLKPLSSDSSEDGK